MLTIYHLTATFLLHVLDKKGAFDIEKENFDTTSVAFLIIKETWDDI